MVLEALGGVSGAGKVLCEAKREFERVEVDERRDERPHDVLCDAKEKQRGLDDVRIPPDVKAPNVLLQTRTSKERFAAAQRRDRHSRQHHHHHRSRSRRCRPELRVLTTTSIIMLWPMRGAGQGFVDGDGGVEDAFCVGAPAAGDARDAGECVSREAVKDGAECLVWKAISKVAVVVPVDSGGGGGGGGGGGSCRRWQWKHRRRGRRRRLRGVTRARAMEDYWHG